ncbi:MULTISPECIES: S1/P1 nuclease [Rufibacter]|uniref:S1/P1 Nuclease n=1 Tax=Rufibacter quisquiliarum TaxID=1549639 RepID=A0A839GFY7_9BACT|nr:MULTISPECIES: S1/P1 nuclease [Rufibacter]MBA9075579.1 hypothetical protein [Rufibacter quisquiliarum]
MKVLQRVLLLCLFVYLPLQSMAWGMLGHRIVGEIAERHLSNRAKKNIRKVLGPESVAMVSNWPDFVKSDPAFDYLDTWHYINLKEGLTQAEVETILKQDTAVDAYTRINFLIAELKKKELEPVKKAQYLKILIHLVGDVHQPMHVGRPEDLGGNRIRVEWFNQPTNLHRLWDSQLIEYQQLSYTEYATALNCVSKEQSKIWKNQPMTQWFFESYQIADQLYKGVKPQEKLSYTYNFHYIATLNAQLLKGGVRLAGVLEEIFGS